MIDREKAKETFLSYAARYDMNDPKIRLKVEHTLRVAELCEVIARSVFDVPGKMPQDDIDTAWLCGLLHDIGRFEQVRIYHTFRDADSVDHAQLSADLLFKEGMIREYPADGTYNRKPGTQDFGSRPGGRYDLIETAIRSHNAYRLPETLTQRELMFCNILRDADKIDILRVNRETPMTEIYNLPEDAFLDTEISDPVYADMLAHRDVNRANSKTGVDFLMGHIAFVFGLVYPVSLHIAGEQGYLNQMLAFESRNPVTRKRMAVIREEVEKYISQKAGTGEGSLSRAEIAAY